MAGPKSDQLGYADAGLDEGDQLREAWVRGLRTLFAVSQHISTSSTLPAFFGALTRTIAHLTGAERAAFWAIQPEEHIAVQPQAYGFPEEDFEPHPIPSAAGALDVAHAIVTGDPIWHVARRFPDDPPTEVPWLDVPGVRDAVVVPWRVGAQRLGLLGVYDSHRPHGFTESDVWVARIASVAAGLVWQDQQAANRLVQVERDQSARLREYAERMSSLERIKSSVLNLAAHELRSPVAVIRGYVSMLEDGSLSAPDEVAEVWPILTAKADQISMQVEQMLETARMEGGRVELDLEELDLRKVVQAAVAAAGPRTRSGQWFVVQQERRPVTVTADPRRLSTIVANLIDNAIKYSPNGGPIQCSVRIERSAAVVAVRDQGIGIAENDLPTLFSRFGRIVTQENSHVPGTGLGLYLCRELALMHGGDIAVASQPGKGSAFDLVLPRMNRNPDAVVGKDAGAAYDIRRFGRSEMIRCSATLRQLGSSAGSFDEAAGCIVRHFRERLHAGGRGRPAVSLVRLYRGIPYFRLTAEQRRLATAFLGREPDPSVVCLCLAGTAGERPEWNRVRTSAHQRVVPLYNGNRPPLLTRMVSDFGVDPGRVRDPELFLDLIEKTCNVFHIPDLATSAYPDEVESQGIASVLGFGGVLAPQEMYAVVIFSKAPIGRESAGLFRGVSHSAKLALQPFVGEAAIGPLQPPQ